MPGVEAITDSMDLVLLPVVGFVRLQFPDTATKKPSDPAASRTGTIITGTVSNCLTQPQKIQVHNLQQPERQGLFLWYKERARIQKTLQWPTATGACDCRLEAVTVSRYFEGVWLEIMRDIVGVPLTIYFR